MPVELFLEPLQKPPAPFLNKHHRPYSRSPSVFATNRTSALSSYSARCCCSKTRPRDRSSTHSPCCCLGSNCWGLDCWSSSCQSLNCWSSNRWNRICRSSGLFGGNRDNPSYVSFTKKSDTPRQPPWMPCRAKRINLFGMPAPCEASVYGWPQKVRHSFFFPTEFANNAAGQNH